MDEPRVDSLNTGDLVAWAAELQAGNPDAAEPTFRRIVSRVEKFAGSMFTKFPRVGRFVDLDDVVQNSLIRLLAAFRQIRPDSTRHFYALTNELIRRELLDLTKHYYGPRGHGSNLATVAIEAGDHAPADVTAPFAAELDRMTAFHEAVAGLPAEEREAISLTYYHGWTRAEIADLFGVSVKTVQRWRDGGAEALRKKLGDCGIGKPG